MPDTAAYTPAARISADQDLTGRILVVDDQEMNRDMLSRRLRRLGHDVSVAADGAEALALLRDPGGYDLLLLDIMMPGMDGYEVLAEVKADAALRDVPVIMISALDDIDSVVRCIELGAEDHLPKPFNPVLLRARIGSCLTKKRLRDLEQRHARGLERDLAIGRRIQAGFLPQHLPDVPGWEIAGRFRPARQVAGDFYDVFPVAQGRLIALVVADVCDKGVGAALFMALCRSLIRALTTQRFAREAGADGAGPTGDATALRDTVAFINDYIAGVHADANMFATLFFGLLDPETGDLLYINAGHDAPMLAGPAGVRTTLPPTGPAVGLLPGLPFETARVGLARGEILVVHTDGVTDARSPAGVGFGDAGLTEIVEASQSASAAGLLTAIEDAVARHTAGAAAFDDVTLLAARRSP